MAGGHRGDERRAPKLRPAAGAVILPMSRQHHAPLPPPEPGPGPAPGYRRTFLDRTGSDGGLMLKCASWGLYVFGVSVAAAALLGADALGMMLFAIGGLVLGGLAALGAWYFASAAGAGFKAFIQPSGASTPYQRGYSYEESLAARGDIVAALGAYEQRIADDPADVEVRVRAAELYSRKDADPARAAELFREIRTIPGVAPARVLYASHRLIDLYRGPLDDEGRMLVELRRIVETFPRTPDADRARDLIRELKEGRSEERPSRQSS